ncbi:MAG: fibronectin type III domain-containing protein, partial [Lachnospiraceae bacterium]
LEGYPVVAIADDAFLENKNLKSITFPDSLEEIGNFSFASCESLEKTIFPKSVTFIGDQAFANCSKLKDFSVSSENQTYTTIDGVLFSKDKTTLIICPSGKTGTKDYPGTYEIPSGVTNIASHAFTGCNALSSIIFPESVISLGDEIFTNTGSLHKIFFKGKPPAFSDSTLTGSLLSRIYYSFIFDTEWQDISKNTYGGKASTQWLKSDIWSFSNNYISSAHPDGMGTISDGYILTDSDYQRLTSNLEEVDFQRIDYALKHSTNNWGGSCYGLSTWVCMNYAGEKTSKDIENVTNIQDASDCLYEWDNRAEIKSAINFYHLQKNLLYTKGYCLEFMEFSQGIQLTKLHNLALQNTPFVITFSLYNSQGNETGHAIVGYGMESGSYQKTITIGDEKYTHTYPYRIKIYDPNWPNGGDEYYIYYDVNYDDNKNIWCIPGYNIISTSNDISADEDKHDNAQLNLVTNDMEQLNSIDYTTGKINFKYASETLKNLFELISENTCYNITIGEKTYTISGFNISTEDSDKADHSIRIFPDWNETVEDDFSDSQTTVTLPFNEDGYQISCLEDSMKFALYGQNYFLTVNANSPGTIDFSNTGNISVNLEEETYYHLSITANNGYNGTIWNTVEAQGTGSGTIELKQKDSGIEINGDQAGETTITVSDKDKTQLITVNSEQDCIFITDDNGKLTAYEDSDNNGDYDTKLPNLNTVPISNCEIAINPVSYIYTGKPITPSIKVTYKDSVLAEGENYAITYEKNINVGTASVIITGIGDYNGTITKNYFITKANNVISASNKTKTVSTKTQSLSLGASAKEKTKLSYTSNSKSITVNPSGKVTIKKNYVGQATITITAAETANYKKAVKKITVTVNPKGTKISKISNSAAKKVTVKWKKNSAVNGYQIQYSTNSAFSSFKTITVKKYQTVSTIISKLQKEKTYYVRIRTYKKASGKSYYSTWSSKKKIKVKK